MASEKKMNESSTSFHQSDAPILCANGCGFFGTPSTLNLCSKCYRDSKMREEQAATAMAAVEKSMASIPYPEAPVLADNAAEEPVLSGSSSSAADSAPPPAKVGNRCGNCNKKVGVMGFMCRCGSTFCGSHRYPEEHGCTFDFKEAAKDAIAKANPVVKADKVERL